MIGEDLSKAPPSQEVLRFLREVDEDRTQSYKRSTSSWTTTRSHKHEKRARMDRTQEARLPPLHPDQRVLGWIWSSGSLAMSHAKTDWRRRCRYSLSVPHLEKCLREYLESYNENPLRPWSGQSPSRKSSKKSVGGSSGVTAKLTGGTILLRTRYTSSPWGRCHSSRRAREGRGCCSSFGGFTLWSRGSFSYGGGGV